MSLWRKIQKQNFTQIGPLCDFLQLSEEQRARVAKSSKFNLNLPRRLADKMPKGTLDDPLIRQFVPLIEEERITPGFDLDPVSDLRFRLENKLLQKYTGRVLLLTTSACPMHCRFCFRQNFPYDTADSLFEEELAQIAEDFSIEEVILSGGDPLSFSNERLEGLIAQIGAIPHVKRLRFHTRFPVGIPERIDEGFLAILEGMRMQGVVIIHTNSVRELDEEVFEACQKIQRLGIPVMTHTVLLRGVNDSLEELRTLFETLVNRGVLPYYLNQLDRVQGTAHFEVPISEGLRLMEQLRACLPGYAVPRYAHEIAGLPSKYNLESNACQGETQREENLSKLRLCDLASLR